MKTWLAIFVAVAAASAQAENVVLTLDPSSAGAEVSPDFIGLSYEMSNVLPDADGQYFFSPRNHPLITLFRTLGVKSLRVGGNTADRPTIKMPAKEDIDSLFAFARAADVKVLYTLRLNQGMAKPVVPGPVEAGSKETLNPYDPKADAATAQYILDHYRSNLDSFIIGNEPDHYYASFESYRQGWKTFADAITAPGAKFSGPSTTPRRAEWVPDFARDLGRDPRVVFITQHEYPAGSGRITDVAAARARLLSPDIDSVYEKFYDTFVPSVLEVGQHFRLEECNSFSNGGAPGVSDTFAATVWGVDYMYWWASHHASGLNFHTSGAPPGSRARGAARYAVFVNAPGGYAVRPLGYALKAFELGSGGRLLEVKCNSEQKNLRAYGVLAPDGSIFVTLVNKDYHPGAGPIEAILETGQARRRAQIVRLQAEKDDVAALDGITLGGAAIGEDGSWHGAWSDLPSETGRFSVRLPAASVAVIKLAAEYSR